MLVSMRRIELIAPRSRASAVMRTVHRVGVLHLVPFEQPGGGPVVFDHPATPARTSPYEAGLERATELAGLLGPSRAPGRLVAELWALDDRALAVEIERLGPLRDRATALTAERIGLDGQASRLDSYRRLIDGLRGVVGRLPAVRGFGSTGIVVGARHRPVIGLIREELERMCAGRCEVVVADLDPDRVAAILLYPTRLAGEVQLLLGSRDLEEVTLPEELAGVPFDDLAPRLAAESALLRDASAAAGRELVDLADRDGPWVAAIRLVLLDRVAEARAIAGAGTSDHLFVLGAWLPADALDALRARLQAEIGPEVVVIERDARGEQAPDAPVILDNRRLTRAFEPLAVFVTLPRYGSLDPTPLLAITLPAFVGLMIGDAGYGLVLLGLLALAHRRWRSAAAMAVIWPVGVTAALATVAFGVLFGEWFGAAGHDLLGIEPLWLDRREGMITLLVLALSIGVAQIGLGLVLGAVNAVLLRHRRELAGRIALLVSLVAILAILGWIVGRLPDGVGFVGLASLVIALAVLIATLGLAGPIEVMGMLGNIVSYARLMAIGLASVMLAVVAARLAGLFENVIVGALVAALVHTLNLVLGVFDSTVQGLRLHYVEFFTKFVEPGGVRYAPFASALPALDRPSGRGPTGG
jgi:V/A-type H+/Na+-transporting ATPase subunit I